MLTEQIISEIVRTKDFTLIETTLTEARSRDDFDDVEALFSLILSDLHAYTLYDIYSLESYVNLFPEYKEKILEKIIDKTTIDNPLSSPLISYSTPEYRGRGDVNQYLFLADIRNDAVIFRFFNTPEQQGKIDSAVVEAVDHMFKDYTHADFIQQQNEFTQNQQQVSATTSYQTTVYQRFFNRNISGINYTQRHVNLMEISIQLDLMALLTDQTGVPPDEESSVENSFRS